MRVFVVFMGLIILVGCTVNTTTRDVPGGVNALLAPTGSNGRTYSLYGKGVQYDNDEKVYFINVYAGGAGNDAGARNYAKSEIEKYVTENGYKSYEVEKSEYSFFPLSKYKLYIKFN